MSSHMLHLWKSSVRIVTDLIAEVGPSGISPGLEFINMDAHAEIAEWPDKDLIGISMFSMRLDEHLIRLDFAIGVSTYEDPQLLRHIQIMDRVVEKLKPATTHPVFHADTAEKLGWMQTFNGTEVLRMERTESRPLQFTLASFGTGLSYQLCN